MQGICGTSHKEPVGVEAIMGEPATAGATQLVCTVRSDSRILGYIVIDSTVGGRSRGGLRMLPDIDEEEMRGVARSMTLKYGFLGLPQGGAKGGVLGDPEAPEAERKRVLERFGAAAAPLLRSHAYIPDADMGTTSADIRHMLMRAGVRIKLRELQGKSSGYYTSLTVMAGARQAAGHLDMHLAGATAAVEGFGKVGRALAGLLSAARVRVVAVSTSRGAIFHPEGIDVERLRLLAETTGSRVVEQYPGAERMDARALPELPIDFLFPCARHNTIHAGNAEQVKARVICPGANNPVTLQAEEILSRKGILCLPDFVANSGGVLGGTMEFAGVERSRIESFVEKHIGERIAWILNEARSAGVTPREVAAGLAMRRFEQVQKDAATPTLRGRVFGAALELYRRGYVPGRLVARFSLPYFLKCLATY